MSGRLQAAFVLALLGPASTQSEGQEVQLPPGILLLSRIKHHVARELEHLPEYTCLETVDRSIARGENKGKSGKLEPLDTLRLEILYSGHKELYASPGAHVFRDESPAEFVAGGMIGDGVFATQLQTIFVSETALFNFRGEDTVARDRGWGRAVKYDFRIPANQSGWNIHLLHAHGVIGEKGSFWADPETLELLRIEVHADEVPPDLRLADVIITSDYSRMRIGEEDIMLPQAAEMRLLELSGREYRDQFEYTHCRSYRAQSSINFNEVDPATPKPAPEPGAPGPVSLPGVSGNLPAGLQVPVTLATPIDSNSTVGTLLEGRVAADVDFKGRTLIPKGASIHGRLRRLERYRDAGDYYVVGLEFTEVEAGGSLWRFYADLKSAAGAPVEWLMSTGGSRAVPNGYQSHTETIRLPDLPGVGSFFLRGARFALPVGFRMEWKTRALAQ